MSTILCFTRQLYTYFDVKMTCTTVKMQIKYHFKAKIGYASSCFILKRETSSYVKIKDKTIVDFFILFSLFNKFDEYIDSRYNLHYIW